MAVAYFKVLLQQILGGAEHNSSPGRDSNPEPPEYEEAVLTTTSRRSVHGACSLISAMRCRCTKWLPTLLLE
jgi:hypothetical protein